MTNVCGGPVCGDRICAFKNTIGRIAFLLQLVHLCGQNLLAQFTCCEMQGMLLASPTEALPCRPAMPTAEPSART